MEIHSGTGTSKDIAQLIQTGQPVLFLVGSYVSLKESGVPGVREIVPQIQSDLRKHPAFANVPDWVFLPLNVDRVQFEVYFQLFEEYVDGSLAEWAMKELSGGTPSEIHRFLASLAETYPNVNLATTNFDRLVEETTNSLSSITFPTASSSSSKGVYKLHGSVDEPSSTVLSMRRIAVGLPESAQSWLSETAERSAIVYLGWSGNDFDIYPTILQASGGAHDIFTIRPKLAAESDEDYEQAHWRQAELQRRRNTRIVPGYEEFLLSLAAELGMPVPIVSSVALRALTNTDIPDRSHTGIRNYLVALLEYAGAGFHAGAVLEALPPDDVRSRSLERRVLQALGRFTTMARRGRVAYLNALREHQGEFERIDGLSDWATARCNQRMIWNFYGSWRASRTARRLVPKSSFEWDIRTRAMQHWAVGVVIMADVLTRLHVPGHTKVRAIAERMFDEVGKFSSECGDMHRRLTCDLEIRRSRSYSQGKKDPTYVAGLMYACRELAQLGRGHDLTIYVDRGASTSVRKRSDAATQRFFIEMLVDRMLIASLEDGAAMVLLKGLKSTRKVKLSRDPALLGECRRWANKQGQFGLWRPFKTSVAVLDIEGQRGLGRSLASRLRAARPELIAQLL